MTNLPNTLNLINYAFVLFFGHYCILMSGRYFFSEASQNVSAVLPLFWHRAGNLLPGTWGESIISVVPAADPSATDPAYLFGLKKSIYVSMVAVLSAYLMCTPRKWVGTFVSSFFDYDPLIADAATIIVTLPLLFLVVKYMAPHIIKLKHENKTILTLFLLLPLSYYILEYAFTVYTDLMYTGGPVIIDFMDSFLVPFVFYPVDSDY